MIGKPIVTVFTAVVLAIIGFLDDHVISSMEWLLVIMTLLTAIPVYIYPNLSGGAAKYTKALTQFFTAVVGALILFWSGGVDLSEWLQVAVIGLGALGVVVPKAPQYSPSQVIGT